MLKAQWGCAANTAGAINLPLHSKLLRWLISSSVKLKSKTLKFSCILENVTDFGIAWTPRWMHHRRTTWAAVFPYFFATSTNLGSSKSLGSSGLAKGRSGDPSGLYAVTIISLALQNLINFCWLRYGCTSICRTAGLI